MRAVIRELAANAKDAMIDASKGDQPFEIHLPNRFEPWFSVKDYGIGLSHDDVMHLYSTYFESTKTDSNEVTGCLGLGSKSPFAYVDGFTVESRWDGVLTVYSCAKNEKGMPTITVLGDPAETDETNGIEVKMAVKDEDMREFATKAAKELRHFDPAPTITGNTDYGIEEIDYWLDGTDWKMIRGDNYYSYGSANIHAIQGNVTYPIEADSLKDLTEAQKSILNTKLDLWFPLGDLDVAPSREMLSYNDTTIANIKARLDLVAKEVVPLFQDQFDDAKTLWDARKIFGTMSNELPSGLKSLLADSSVGLKWKGQKLSSHFTLDKDEIDFNIICFERGCYGNRGRKMDYGYHRSKKIAASDNVAFYYDDLGHGSHSRLTYYLDEGNGGTMPRHNYLLKTDAKKDLRKISKTLGNVKIQAVSNLPKKPRAERAERQVTSKVLEYIGSSSDRRDSWKPTKIKMKEGGIYVTIQRYKVYDKIDGSWSDIDYSFDSIINAAKEHNIIDLTDKPIYGIRKGDVEKMKDDSGWVSLFDLIRDNIGKVITKEKAALKIANHNAFEIFDFDFSDFDNEFIAEGFTKGTPLFKFIKAYKYMRDQDTTRAAALRNVAVKVRYDMNKVGAKHDLKKLWEVVKDTYPLLSLISSNSMRGGYYRTDDATAKDNFAKLVDYIKMVDAQAIPLKKAA